MFILSFGIQYYFAYVQIIMIVRFHCKFTTYKLKTETLVHGCINGFHGDVLHAPNDLYAEYLGDRADDPYDLEHVLNVHEVNGLLPWREGDCAVDMTQNLTPSCHGCRNDVLTFLHTLGDGLGAHAAKIFTFVNFRKDWKI